MSITVNEGDTVKVVFVYPKTVQTEEANINIAQLSALLHSKQLWIEKFKENLKI